MQENKIQQIKDSAGNEAGVQKPKIEILDMSDLNSLQKLENEFSSIFVHRLVSRLWHLLGKYNVEEDSY